MSQLQRRCGHVGDRPLPAAAVATGRGRANVPCYFTWQRALHVDQAQQSLLYPFIIGFYCNRLVYLTESSGVNNKSVKNEFQDRFGSGSAWRSTDVGIAIIILHISVLWVNCDLPKCLCHWGGTSAVPF